MNLLNRFWLIFLCIISINLLNAQTPVTADLNKSLIPPSPDAASLGKYGIQPVALYEGISNTSIPVYELKTAKLSLSLSLGYNYNGYRPGEESSWIGLGWSLQGAGAITRIVKGSVDGATSSLQHEWKDYANILDLSDKQDFLTDVASNLVDPEPDIYAFSFNGHSGKFIMQGSRAFTFPHQDLAITVVGNGFKIIAEDGIIYNFYNTETTTPNSSSGFYLGPYISAWNLSSIISADGTDEIDLSYTLWSHRQYNDSYSETYTQQRGKGLLGDCNGMNSGCDAWSVYQYPGAMIAAQRLSSITSKNSIIQFVPEVTARLDLNSTSAFALKEINILRLPNSALIKKMELVHSYFGNNSKLKLSSVNLKGYLATNKTSVADITLPGYYGFQYANEDGNFPKSTRGIDKYGYYNGKDNNAMLFDADLLPNTLIRPPGDRSVDPARCINGILTKLTYPTGGYTAFEYENNLIRTNTSNNVIEKKSSALSTGYNGVKADSTTTGTVFNIDIAQTISFNYARVINNTVYPFGTLNIHRVFKLFRLNLDALGDPVGPPSLIYMSPLLGKSPLAGNATMMLTPGYYSYFVTCDATSTQASAAVAYTVTHINAYLGDPGPGMRIKAIRSYDGINTTAPAFIKKYAYTFATPLSIEGYGSSSTNHYVLTNGGTISYAIDTYTSNYSSSLFSLMSNQFYYASVTETNDEKGILGKTIYQYGGDGYSALGVHLINQSDFSYNSAINDYVLTRQYISSYITRPGINFWGFTNLITDSYDSGPSSSSGWAGLSNSADLLDWKSRLKLYKAIPYAITSNCYQLNATDEITNDQNGANPMKVHTDYYYDNDNYLQPSRTIVSNSKGEAITTQFKYPFDCGVNPLVNSTCNFPAYQDYWFKNKRDASSDVYKRCTNDRYNYALKFYNPLIANSTNTPLQNALNSYPCEANYPTQFSAALKSIENVACPVQNGNVDAGIASMQVYHILNIPVEKIVSINKGAGDYLLGAIKTEFTTNGGYTVSPKTVYSAAFTTSPFKSDFIANPANYYQPKVNFVYNAFNNIIEQSKINDAKEAYVWGYNNINTIAKVINADNASIAATSFEPNGSGNFSFAGMPITDPSVPAITGNFIYNLSSGSITKGNLPINNTYTVSYWSKNGAQNVNSTAATSGQIISQFTYYEHIIVNPAGGTITISGTGTIDELRLYPQKAQMSTYTYDPLIGMTSQTDANNKIIYYQYDALGRLSVLRDQDKNILKLYCYNYAGQPENCTSSFYNTLQSGSSYTRNNCESGYTGGAYTTTVIANTYSSTISVADANQQAQNYLSSVGQSNANQYGSCTQIFYNTQQSGTSFTRNNCGSGYLSGSYISSVAANTYSSIISIADANQQAQNYLSSVGQSNANQYGSCTPIFYNTLQSGTSFTRNNCGSGYLSGSYVSSVAANTYSSTISIADANQQAQNYLGSIGQSNANQYGSCTTIFYNTQQSGKAYTRNNCGPGYTGGTYITTVASNTYSSLVNVADANQQAQNYLSSVGQSNANQSGSCMRIFYNIQQSATFRRNNCGSRSTGGTYITTVAANTYSSTISVADANMQALNYISSVGQQNANQRSSCTPTSR